MKIFRQIRDYFIPHSGNNYKPYSLRWKSAIFLFLTVLFIELLVVLTPIIVFRNVDFLATILPSVLINITNGQRSENMLSPLTPNGLLEKAAQLKAEDMAKRGYFSHIGPGGETPWHWLDLAGYKYSYAGENLAVNFFDSEDVAEAWMNSSAHRANILNYRFTDIGIGVAQGTFEGKSAVFVVQFFGTPSVAYDNVRANGNKIQEKNKIAEGPSSTPTNTKVLGEITTQPPKSPSITERLISSPHYFGNYLFLGLMIFFVIALAFAILIKTKIQYPLIIVNGLILITLIILVMYFNRSFFAENIKVPADFLGSAITNSLQ